MSSNSNGTRRSGKAAHDRPKKPFESFPLYAHPLGYWSKKIKGTIYHFGRWGRVRKGKLERVAEDGNWEEALRVFKAQHEDIEAGRNIGNRGVTRRRFPTPGGSDPGESGEDREQSGTPSAQESKEPEPPKGGQQPGREIKEGKEKGQGDPPSEKGDPEPPPEKKSKEESKEEPKEKPKEEAPEEKKP